MNNSSAHAILALSRLASGRLPAGAFIHHVGSILFERLGLARIVINASHPETRQVHSFESGAVKEELRPSQGYVFVTEEISAQGLHLGRIELHAIGSGGERGSGLLAVAEITASQIGRYLNLDAERIRNSALKAEGIALRAKLETAKVVSRAAGIVAVRKGVSEESALQWLLAQATRRGRDIHVVAQSVIKQSQFAGPSVPGLPAHAFRRSA